MCDTAVVSDKWPPTVVNFGLEDQSIQQANVELKLHCTHELTILWHTWCAIVHDSAQWVNSVHASTWHFVEQKTVNLFLHKMQSRCTFITLIHNILHINFTQSNSVPLVNNKISEMDIFQSPIFIFHGPHLPGCCRKPVQVASQSAAYRSMAHIRTCHCQLHEPWLWLTGLDW